MPKHPLEQGGEDKVICVDGPVTRYPHGRSYGAVLVKRSWVARAHRGKVLEYGHEQTDCQFVKQTHKKYPGKAWQTSDADLRLDLGIFRVLLLSISEIFWLDFVNEARHGH